jgi:Lrp/AsnC family transcriptional regulator for asnA, asnC and gidA
MVVEIDGIDKEILRFLMEDARKPILQIANKIEFQELHPSVAKTRAIWCNLRIKICSNHKVLGYNTMAFVGVYLDKAETSKQLKN